MRPARCGPDRPRPSTGSGCRAFGPASWPRKEWRRRSPPRSCGNIRPQVRQASDGRSPGRKSHWRESTRGRCQAQSTRSPDKRLAGAIGFRGRGAFRCLTQRARSPIQARFESRSSSAALTIHRGSTPNGASVFARPRSSIDEFGNHSKLRVSRGSWSRTQRSVAGRARPSTARRLTQRTVSESQSKTSRPGIDRCASRRPGLNSRAAGST